MTSVEKSNRSLYSATAKLTQIECAVIKQALDYVKQNRQNSQIEQLLIDQTIDHLNKVEKQFDR